MAKVEMKDMGDLIARSAKIKRERKQADGDIPAAFWRCLAHTAEVERKDSRNTPNLFGRAR